MTTCARVHRQLGFCFRYDGLIELESEWASPFLLDVHGVSEETKDRRGCDDFIDLELDDADPENLSAHISKRPVVYLIDNTHAGMIQR